MGCHDASHHIFVLRYPAAPVQHHSQLAQPIRLHATRTFIVAPMPPYYCPGNLQGVVNCYVLDNFARSYKRLATPCISDGKPSRGARQRVPARTFRPTSSPFRLRLVDDPAVLAYPNSPDCRPDLGHLSPVLVGRNQVPSLIFTDTAESPAFRLTSWALSTELSEPKQVSCPRSSETRPNTLHFHFIASFEVPQTRKRSAVPLWLFKY